MAKKLTFENVSSNINFPKSELEILTYWKKINAFKTSLVRNSDKTPYSFYDGPPFATGLPHYGHILAGTIKDVVTRFAHQNGHSVERRFGWDTHGLPVEFEIDKKFGIKTHSDVLDLGVEKYNAACREIVMRYSSEWKEMIERCGRWIDFENDYKTLDKSYMESVWWVFKTVFDKGLIYRGQKVMPYSPRLGTPLSNFEANLNYKDVSDPSVVVKFPLRKEFENTFLLAWTTTPWTLISHMAICVREDLEYSLVKDLKTGEQWILSSSRFGEIYKKPKEGIDYKVIRTFSGKELVGKEYDPPFDYFVSERDNGAFRVVSDDYVTDSSGTGLVHQAPGFGEDDYRVCKNNGIIDKDGKVICPLDANCNFTDEIPEFSGLGVEEANRKVIRDLRERGKLAKESQIRHSYPFCWRSECPLMYRAVPSWFLNVEQIKSKLIANNKKTKWVPSYVQEKRFANWLEDARDWAISRNRFWGTPLPIWTNEDFSEVIVIGSIEELERMSGVKGIKDLHRENIDKIKIPSQKGKEMLSRIDEVFDCWFESGSMPYAQIHYPFENKEKFEKTFPADFVAEGLDQTRGWFYTMMVLSTALFDKPAFKNLICNGLVLAEDGKKMSKRLKNYPDPKEILQEYGADALRICLINSPAVRAESIRFTKTGVHDVVKSVLLLWYNTYRFFIENATRFEMNNNKKFENEPSVSMSDNKLDQWIISSLMSLLSSVRTNMETYQLYKVTPSLINFLNQLSLWYVRFNRPRMKGLKGVEESLKSLKTLHFSLFTLCRIMAPFSPFIVEKMYQNLKLCLPNDSEQRQDSVHYLSIPKVDKKAIFPEVERALSRMQEVIELGRTARVSKSLKFKQPLASMVVVHSDEQYLNDIKEFENYIKQDLNIEKIEYNSQLELYTSFECTPNRKNLGRRLRKKASSVCSAIQKLNHSEITELRNKGEITILGEKISIDDVMIEVAPKDQSGRYCSASGNGACVILDTKMTADLEEECLRRELISHIQQLKKKANLNPSVRPYIFIDATRELLKASKRQPEKTFSLIGANLWPMEWYKKILSEFAVVIAREKGKIGTQEVEILMIRSCLIFSDVFLAKREKNNRYDMAVKYLISRNFEGVKRELKSFGLLKVPIESGDCVILREGRDIYTNMDDIMKNAQ